MKSGLDRNPHLKRIVRGLFKLSKRIVIEWIVLFYHLLQ
jgi:hypothetical protein